MSTEQESSEPIADAAPAAAEPQSLEDVLSEQMGATFDKIEARERAPDKGADGRFVSANPTAQAPTEAAPAATNTDQPAPKEGETPAAPAAASIAAPNSWSDADKAWFATLPPDRQAHLAKREGEAHQTITRQGETLAKFEPLGRVLQPHMGRLSQAGVAPPEYVNRLLNADAALANPATRMEAIQHVAQLYGIDLRQVAGQSAGQAAASQAPADPALAALFEQVNGIKSWVANQHQQQQAQRQAASDAADRDAQTKATAFLNDPKFPHAQALETDMASLIIAARSLGQTLSLEDAYKKAARANDSVWQQIDAADKAAAKKAADEDAAKKAAEAKRRAPTIVKPRGSGAVAPSSAATWEERMNEVYDRVQH